MSVTLRNANYCMRRALAVLNGARSGRTIVHASFTTCNDNANSIIAYRGWTAQWMTRASIWTSRAWMKTIVRVKSVKPIEGKGYITQIKSDKDRTILRVIGNVRDNRHCTDCRPTRALQKCYVRTTYIHAFGRRAQYSSTPHPFTTYVRKWACARPFCACVTLVLLVLMKVIRGASLHLR